MKKAVCLVLMVLLLIGTAVAEVDLSGMSYDELVALKDKINLAMWECEEWQEVKVPVGVWKVGEDIPAGHWTIRSAEEDGYTHIEVGDRVSEDGKKIDLSGNMYYAEFVYGKEWDSEEQKQWDYEFKDGMYILIEKYGAIFTPYTGKPSLGFK